jgi:predicted RNA-binding protein YlxR (DUF448 family)
VHIKQERRCVACRENKQQNEMLRIARINDNYLIDDKNTLGGRGAYVCSNKKCIELTIKKKLLNKAFKTNIDVQIYEKLGEYEQNN